MLLGKKILALIPARGASRKLPGKYLRKVAGQTLLSRTIQAAQKSRFIDQLILSSDELAIIQEAKNYNCDVPFLRPKSLAGPDVPLMEVLLHATDQLPQYDLLVVLPPSSPFRSAEDIDQCLSTFAENPGNACVSLTEPPYGTCSGFRLGPKKQLIPSTPGHFLAHSHLGEPCYVHNGAIAVADINWLRREQSFLSNKTVGYVMPRERSLYVDSEFDLWLANMYQHFLERRVSLPQTEESMA